MTTTPTPSANTSELRQIRARLRTVRRAGRTMLLVRETSRLLSLGILLVAAMVLVDFTARLPMALRLCLLLALAVWGVIAYIRRFHPVTRFRPPLADVASRVEAWLATRGGTSGSALTGGVGLRDRPGDDALTRSLTRLASHRVSGVLPGIPWGVLRWKRPAAALLLLIAVSVSASAVFRGYPVHSVTGLTRLFAPWSDAAWPRRTALADNSPQGVHPSDSALPLRVALTKSNKAPGEADISVRYRVEYADGTVTPESQAVLVPQPTVGGAENSSGEIYERLIETAAWSRQSGTTSVSTPTGTDGDADASGDRWLVYSFRSEDDRTATRRVRVVDPPVLRRATVSVTPPAYVSSIGAGNEVGRWIRGDSEAKTTDAAIGPILRGSTVRLVLEYSKPIEAAGLELPDGAVTLSDGQSDGRTVTIELTPEDSTGIVAGAVDADGLRTRDAFRARLSVIGDRVPTASVVDPAIDRAVLATAVIPLGGEASDDLALGSVRLEYRVAAPDPGSLAGEPEAVGDPVVLVSLDSIDAPLGENAVVEYVLDLPGIGATAGQELWVQVVASDTYELHGDRHEPVISSPRRIRIIEESRFIELLQAELEGVRRRAISLDRRQAAIMEDADSETVEQGKDDGRSLQELAARQAEVAQQLRGQVAVVERLAERLEQNRVQDGSIRALVDRASHAADQARAAADRATGQAAARASEPSGDDPGADPTEQQEKVREALSRLIDELDRGQDDWVVRRALERLVESQRAIREETGALGERTSGRALEELTPDERTELERIADRQRELARQAQNAIDDLAERANEIRENDPTQAAALDEAARGAAEKELTEALSKAGAQIGQNQTGEAGETQDQTIEDIEAMLEQLENAQRMRDSALRRELASLIQSIQSLIRQQTAAIGALDGEIDGARGLIERVRTNTIAAAASASEGFAEMNPIAELLNRASDAQLTAVRSLRAVPATLQDARAAETEALARLQEALAEAKKQDEDAAQREQERQRRELIDAYREALAAQAEIGARTRAIDTEQLTRRDRATLRAIGRDQEAARVQIEGIPEAHQVPEGVISLYHRRIDGSLSAVVRRLGRGDVDASVAGQQASAAAMLRTIVEVLSPQNPPQDEPFDDQQAGGGGGAGGAGGQEQPPIGQLEELRLLRSLQAIVLDETRGSGAGMDQSLAEIQGDLAEQARRIIESMQSGGANGVLPGGIGPEDLVPAPGPENGADGEGELPDESQGQEGARG